ncbi:hypothetical protein Tco_0546726 [Tanacetum coccineum]
MTAAFQMIFDVQQACREDNTRYLYYLKYCRVLTVPDTSGNGSGDLLYTLAVVLSMAEFFRLPNFKGCKITGGALLPPGMVRVTHLANPADTLEDIPPKTVDMTVAEIPSQKVLDDKEKKRKKSKEKDAVNSPAADIQAEKVGIDKGAGKDGPLKKRKVRARPQVQPVSEHVSSPTPLNHAKPLETLANEGHVSPPDSAERMGDLRTQTDEHVTPPHANADEHATGGETHKDANATFIDEGHGDNEGCYSASRFGNLPFTPQWGLTDSSRMDNSRECRDMMSNLFTPADHEFFNEGVDGMSPYHGEEHADLVYAHESCKDVKAHYKDCQKKLVKVQAAYDGKVSDYDQLSKNYEGALLDHIRQLEDALKKSEAEADQLRREKEHYVVEAGRGEMVRQRIINQYLPTFVRRLHQSAEYKRSLRRVFSLAVACASLESKNEVCLLCEVNPKQILAFDFICASLESISAIEDTFGKGEGLPTWLLYNWGWGSRVDEMILARVRSGFAGKKVWGDIPVVTGFWGGKEDFLGEVCSLVP